MDRLLSALPLALLVAMPCHAAVISPIASDARVEPGQSQRFALDATAELLQRKLALSLLARLECPDLGGSTYSMQITINGKPVEAPRLLNKPIETEMLSGLKLDWFGSGAWRVAYSPDYEAADRADHPACLVGGHAYDFVLDLSGLLQAGANEIIVRHSETTIPNALVIKDLALVDAPERVATLEPAEDPRAPLRLIAPTDRRKVAYKLQMTEGGGLRLRCGELALDVTSSFSYPNAGWNVLGQGEVEQDLKCGPVVRTRPGEYGLTAAGQHYRLQRTIVELPDHVAVSDTLTSRTQTDLHVSFRHAIATEGLTGGEVYLRGLRTRIMQGDEAGGDNPTVLVHQGNDGVGLVAEDDVFRAQCYQQALAKPAEALLGDNYFMLEPSASYTIRWSVYPVPDGDYFDFVNAVRRNWGTNFTVPGCFAFPPHPTQERAQVPDLKSWVENGALKIVSLEIPMPEPAVLSHGLAFLREPAEQQRLREQATRLRAAAPGLKVLQYLHVYITRLDDVVETYRDARLLGPDGKQVAYAAGSWKPTFWLFLPTTTNSYGREMNRTFDLVLDQLGFDGVYWDELAYSAKEVAYQVSDGHTGVPDLQTLTVRERAAMVALYCQAYQIQQVNRVLGAGKLLIGNGQPVTETMTKLHFPRFVEAWHPSNLRYAHLYCPVGLSSPDRVRSEEDIVPSVRSHLENGGLWYYYVVWSAVKLTRPTVTAHLFPFTPIELHAGYLIGEERILTARSGLFGWGDQSRARVFVYGPEGTLVPDFQAPTQTIKGANYVAVRLPPGAVGVIERLR